MSISIATMGKFDGVPARLAVSRYGGGSTGGGRTIQQPIPITLNVKSINIYDDEIKIEVKKL